jgi:beta-lactamase superfamily II metal-dependent hydrolase
MPGRSWGRSQTKWDTLVLQVGGWAQRGNRNKNLTIDIGTWNLMTVKAPNWKTIVQDGTKWKDVVEKTKTLREL